MPLNTLRPCPVCGSTDRRSVQKHAAHHIVRCRNCTLAFAGLAPTDTELGAYYNDYPAHANVSPITLKRYDALLDGFERFRTTNRIIDVGCGAGNFLERAALRGWEVHGTEYGRIPIETCRAKGIAVIEGPLNPSNYATGSFDVVTSFEVIEHLVEPALELERMRTMLRPGGMLYVTTPNYRSVGHLLAGGQWSVVNYPEHLNYFTPRTIRRLMRAKGFVPVRTKTTGVDLMRVRFNPVKDRGGRKAIDNQQESLRTKLESSWWLRLVKRTIDGTLDLFGIGDHLKVWAARK